MKQVKLIRIALAVLMAVFFLAVQASASGDDNLMKNNSESLIKLQLISGDSSGRVNLEQKLTHAEFITLTVKMLGYDFAMEIKNTDDLPFTDISPDHWSYKYIKLAVKYKLLFADADEKLQPDRNVVYNECLFLLLRALGYENTLPGISTENIIAKADELGITKNLDLPADHLMTRGDATVLIYNALTVDFNK